MGMIKNITATRNIGTNKGKPRLWIEGKALVEAGLDHGARWVLVASPRGFNIVQAGPSEDRKTRKIAGKPGRPIIDITGATLTNMGFSSGDVARLSYTPNSGCIVVTKETDQ